MDNTTATHESQPDGRPLGGSGGSSIDDSKGYRSDFRTKVAQIYYPEQSAKVAGYIMAGIIYDKKYIALRRQLEASGYQRGKQKYSARQVQIIDQFMQQHQELRILQNVCQYVMPDDKDKIVWK